MGSDWAWGYLAGKRKARRRYERELATIKAQLQAERGQPPAATIPAPPPAYHHPRRRLHLGRWVLLAVVVLALLLVLAFLVYLVVFGLQHGYIYHAHTHG